MLPNFPFKLVTPADVMFNGPVKQVVAVNAAGEFGVLAQHMNFITQVLPDVVTVELADGPIEHYLLTSGGLAEVKGGAMMIIAAEARKFEMPENGNGGAVTDVVTARRRAKDLQTSWGSVVCPATNRGARVKLVQNGTKVVACSNWPERQGCEQACLSRPQ
jgi:ATP synthase, Delta/Epsilon chain, beta-sandwich domain